MGTLDGHFCGKIVTMWLAEVTSLKANGLLGPYKMLLLLLLIHLWPKKIFLILGVLEKIPMVPLCKGFIQT